MEAMLAGVIGLLAGCGVWLVLRPTSFSVVLGLTFLSYAVNLLIFAGGRLDRLTPPLVLKGATGLADPLPQALVLTAIVIGFGMSAFLVVLALGGQADSGSDRIDLAPDGPSGPGPHRPDPYPGGEDTGVGHPGVGHPGDGPAEAGQAGERVPERIPAQ